MKNHESMDVFSLNPDYHHRQMHQNAAKMMQKILQHHFKNAMLRMDTGAPGAIGALIATFGAARYVAGCLGRGGRAIGD